jgi:hypothetical protein
MSYQWNFKGENRMFRPFLYPIGASKAPRFSVALLLMLLLALLLAACDLPGSSSSATPTAGTTPAGNSQPSFPTTPLTLRTPSFGTAGQIAPTVKVLSSADPTLIIQFPLFPSNIKSLFPDATGLVTVFQNPATNDFDTVTVDVQHMPPNTKFTVFFTELSAKPFGHAEYAADVITRGDGSGESVFHLITLGAFAADNRHPVTSTDQSGEASGIQLEHVGMWFDGITSARQVLHNSTLAGTPFDGGGGALHAGPQAMTDGQTLPVI